jgi:alpha-galactosidase
MSERKLTRREFVATSAGALALGAGLRAGSDEAVTAQAGSVRAHGTENEMTMAQDFLRALAAPSGIQRQSATKIFPALMKSQFSFLVDGKNSSEILPNFQVESKPQDSEGGKHRHVIICKDPATGLEARIKATTFDDFPAVEWVVHFKNEGRADTPILSDIQALDCHFESPDADPIIHYAKGATCSMEDFRPMKRVLGLQGTLRLQPGGGRSSSEHLPFFNIESKGEGVVLAIGWTGEWAASFDRPVTGTAFQARAGMAHTNLKLHSGEEVRTPRVLALFWQGDRMRGHNLLRQFILAHHRPTVIGKPLTAPLANHNWGSTTAADHLENIRQIVSHDVPMDYYWIDAEWFGEGPWWKNPGNWQVKKDIYPGGLKPLSDLLHASGRKFLLWFEPERVCEGTAWAKEHPEWLLSIPKEKMNFRGFGGQGEADVPMSDPRWVPMESARNQFLPNDRLFNLANPEARKFLTDFISSRIEEFGIDCYRNDANIAPLEFWRAADAPDRQGITEIRWVEGLYAFWDELRLRHPHLMIDDCASGGRRIDLETIGRSIPLTRTDFVGNILAGQCHSYGLNLWVPLHTTTAGNLGKHTDYNLRSSMTAGLAFGLFWSGDGPQGKVDYAHFPFAEARRSLEQFRTIQKYFYGDYYPLTEYTQAEDAWMAYQLDLPAENEGLVVVLKRPASNYSQAVFPLRALEQASTYEIHDLDRGALPKRTGSQLQDRGLEVNLAAKPDTALIRYRRVF